MDDIMEMVEGGGDDDGEKSWLNNGVALLVVFIAVVMAISQMQSSNVAQAITETKQEINDQWAFYQAKSIKENLHELQLDAFKMKMLSDRLLMKPDVAKAYDDKIKFYDNEVRRYGKEKNEIREKAESLEEDYEKLNARDDKFDMSDAIFSLSLALFAITALTKKKPLFFLSMLIACGGGFFLYQAMTIK